MRRTCDRNRGAKRLLFVALGAGAAALFLYCVPWWIFLLIGIVSLIAAGVGMFAD
ncbi:MAG: hypothetical protein IJJ86_06430 [Clostridia bacterium]|nr:hypothetical protein [Clostridia bacterium]